MNAERCIDLPRLGGKHGQLEDWIAALEAARNELEALIVDLPNGALVWQPISIVQSIGSLLLRIAHSESFWLRGIVDDEGEKYLWDDSGDNMSSLAPPQPPSWYLDRIRTVRAQSLRALLEFPSLDHTCSRPSANGETKRYSLRWVLWHLLENEARHRGQIELLKRWYQQAHAPVYA